MRGKEFVELVRAMSVVERERAVLALVRDGLHVKWPMLPVSFRDPECPGHFFAASDYFAIGEGDDFVRVPLSAPAAAAVAKMLGMILPTPRMVSLIWQAAAVQLEPQAMTPDEGFPYDASMFAADRFGIHNRWIEDGRRARVGTPYEHFYRGREHRVGLIAGQKKDIVITNRLADKPSKRGPYIFGFQKLNGTNIQPLSGFHRNEALYGDYSHGARYCLPSMMVGATSMPFVTVAADAKLCHLISDEGPLTVFEYQSTMPYDVLAPGPVKPALTTEREEGKLSGASIPFQQARNYTAVPMGGRCVKWVVLHTMENPERPNAAEAVASWFAGSSAPKASAHYCVDQDSVVQCVKERDVAWAAPGANRCGVQVEMNGYAAQGAAEWQDGSSRSMLVIVAKLVADICARHLLPVRFVDAEGLLRGDEGVTTHAQVTKAGQLARARNLVESDFFKGVTTHTDPGQSFPMSTFLAVVSAEP